MKHVWSEFGLMHFCICTVALIALSADARAAMPDTIARVKPSIVAVGSYQKTRTPPFLFRGTGFAIGDGRLVATNAHVLPSSLNSENGETLMVLSFSESGEPQPRQANVVTVDQIHDLALVRITGPAIAALELLDVETIREGQTFAFTGFPVGNVLGFAPVTHRGMISAITPIALPSPTSRQLDAKVIRSLRAGAFNVFQLDATAYPGNSGSPLYDPETGKVVGMINMVFVKDTKEAVLSQPSGITFAVPIRYLRELVAKPE